MCWVCVLCAFCQLKKGESVSLTSVSPTHLNVDEDTVVGLVQNFVAFCVQRKLKGDLSFACRDFSRLGHLDITADQLDGLQHTQEIKSSHWRS